MSDRSWVFDLVARDDLVRGRALARHQALIAAAGEALHWSNRVWAQAGTPAPKEPHLAAEMDQARATFQGHRRQTIFGLLDEFFASNPLVRELNAPFAVLYLVWEGRYPDAWRSPDSCLWSPWGWKEGLLRALGRDGVPDEVRPQMTKLIIDVLHRSYRCKDWMYARLVRHICDAQFLAEVEALLGTDDSLVRLRAQFILHVADHPEQRVTRATWQRWLTIDPTT